MKIWGEQDYCSGQPEQGQTAGMAATILFVIVFAAINEQAIVQSIRIALRI